MMNTNLSEENSRLFLLLKTVPTLAKERSAPTEREICRSEREWGVYFVGGPKCITDAKKYCTKMTTAS